MGGRIGHGNDLRPCHPVQMMLMQTSQSDWLAEDDQVFFLLDVVDELDLSAIAFPTQYKEP